MEPEAEIEKSLEHITFTVGVLFDRGERLVHQANRKSLGFSMRRTMGSLNKAKRRIAAQRQAEILEQGSSRQHTAQAWTRLAAARESIQAEHAKQVEQLSSLVTARCDHAMPREQARQVRAHLATIQQVVAETGLKLASAVSSLRSELIGLFSAGVEREVRLARLEMEEEMGIAHFHQLTQLQHARVAAKVVYAAMRWLAFARHSALKRVLAGARSELWRERDKAEGLAEAVARMRAEAIAKSETVGSTRGHGKQAHALQEAERRLAAAEKEETRLRKGLYEANALVAHYRKERVQERQATSELAQQVRKLQAALDRATGGGAHDGMGPPSRDESFGGSSADVSGDESGGEGRSRPTSPRGGGAPVPLPATPGDSAEAVQLRAQLEREGKARLEEGKARAEAERFAASLEAQVTAHSRV